MDFASRRLRNAYPYTFTALKFACKAIHAAVSSDNPHSAVASNYLPHSDPSWAFTKSGDMNMRAAVRSTRWSMAGVAIQRNRGYPPTLNSGGRGETDRVCSPHDAH